MKRMVCFGLFATLLLVPIAAQETLNAGINAPVVRTTSSAQ